MNWVPLPADAYGKLPKPADDRQRALGLARWLETADAAAPMLSARMRALVRDATGERLLAAIFGNSPYLSNSCIGEPSFFLQLIEDGPDSVFAQLMRDLNRQLGPESDRDAVMRALRAARRRVALAVAVADLAQWWRLERVTGALSAFAEAALEAALRHLLRSAAAAREIDLPYADPPERDCGFFALGLGKLGAHELNYSSDIDLMLLYDPEKARYIGRHSAAQFYTRLGQELVRMLSDRTGDGHVFRVDLRLRPDPGSTPAAISTLAALAYYESAGQNWERAALIKARAVAGDRAAGRAFLVELVPYLWRRNLDFAAIQDIHSIKRQINAHRGGGRIAVAGHNVKLGRGGIREIEFFAQTQQLIWGGRIAELRVRGTVEALDALAAAHRITRHVANELTDCYRFLRGVEHRLQMIDDAQTHSLPTEPETLRHVAIFMGYDGADAFGDAMRACLGKVEAHYAHLFEEAPSLAGPGNLVFTGHEDDPDTLGTLRGLGFAAPRAVAAMVRGWHHGRYRASRSQRAREILTELVPALLSAFGRSPAPDAALLRFDHFIARLPAGVQLFSLLYRNPDLLDRLATILGASAWMAEQLARFPHLIEALLHEESAPMADRAALLADIDRALARARHEEDLHNRARRWVGDHKFRVGAALLYGRIDGEQAGRVFAAIAEAAIAGLLPHIETNFARQHGTVAGGGLAVLGLGKLGGREMTTTSDLDLILVYDAPQAVEISTGPHPLPVPTYYARLSQRLVTALTAMTQEGNLYEVDTRLRPSGTSGPAASSLDAFRRYHAELAWTWEHMALTRARLVAGPRALRQAIAAVIRDALVKPRDPATLVVDVAKMRQRIAETHHSPSGWNVKHKRGGLVDIEFIAQYLQLREAAARPDVLRESTIEALRALAAAHKIEPDDATTLIAAQRLWHGAQQMLKLTALDAELKEDEATPALLALLARAAGAVDFTDLKRDMETAAAQAFALYQKFVGAPARAAREQEMKEASK